MARPLPILLLTLSCLWAAPARAEPAAAAALRSRVTPAVIAKWSPEVRFHTWERYFPTSAEALFKGAKAFRAGAGEARLGGGRLLGTPSDLARLGPEWRIQFDPDNPRVKGGDVAGARPDLAVTAPMYVSVQVPADASWVDLRYNFLFGFTGAQPMRSEARGLTFIMPTVGEHDGGWEGVDVRLAPDLQSVILVGTEARGFRRRYQPGEVEWTDSTHPQIRLALHSHAGYNGKGRKAKDRVVLEALKLATVVDLTTRDGPVWRPWTLPDGFRTFGKVDGRLVGRETWTTYPGRLGSQRASQPSAVTGVSGKPFPDRAPWFDASFQQNVLRPVSTFLRSLASGMPCDGIGGRPELEGELAALPALAAQRPYVIRSLASGDLVLSVRQGALVLDPRRPDDPSQTWYAVTGTAKAKGAAVSLVNAQTLTVAGVSPRGGRGAKVTLWHRSINDGSTQWVMARDRSGKCTIRLARSPDLGLHAPDGRGDTVIIHSDAKGSARERTWRLEELP